MRTISTIQRILSSAYKIGLERMLDLYSWDTYYQQANHFLGPAFGKAGETFQKEILCSLLLGF